jgi:hypothetical protein
MPTRAHVLVVLHDRGRFIEMVKQALPLLVFGGTTKADSVSFERLPVDEEHVAVRCFDAALKLER